MTRGFVSSSASFWDRDLVGEEARREGPSSSILSPKRARNPPTHGRRGAFFNFLMITSAPKAASAADRLRGRRPLQWRKEAVSGRAMHDPRVPETLEGWSVLHQMFRVRWTAWRGQAPEERRRLAAQAAETLAAMQRGDGGRSVAGQPARPQGRPDADPPAPRLRGAAAGRGRDRSARARGVPRADDLVRLDGRARDVRDDAADPPPARRARLEGRQRRVRGGLRRRDGGAAQARLGRASSSSRRRAGTSASTR